MHDPQLGLVQQLYKSFVKYKYFPTTIKESFYHLPYSFIAVLIASFYAEPVS